METTTTCGLGECTRSGHTYCSAGAIGDTCVAGPKTGFDYDCNGKDDDCDGSVDEHYNVVSTSCGVGACAATGVRFCFGGAVHDTCSPKPAGDEMCNDLDDDCDGKTDEGQTCRCDLYADADFKKLCMSVTEDVSDLGTHGCNDKISSVYYFRDTRVRLYIDADFNNDSWVVGTEVTLHQATYGNLSDSASSVRIVK